MPQETEQKLWAVSVVMSKDKYMAINVQNILLEIPAVSNDEARGKALTEAQQRLPNHTLVSICSIELTRVAARPLDERQPEEHGWLIEKMFDGNIHYVTVAPYGMVSWTDDPNKALRLARKQDAEMLCNIVEDADKIAEHQWG